MLYNTYIHRFATEKRHKWNNALSTLSRVWISITNVWETLSNLFSTIVVKFSLFDHMTVTLENKTCTAKLASFSARKMMGWRQFQTFSNYEQVTEDLLYILISLWDWTIDTFLMSSVLMLVHAQVCAVRPVEIQTVISLCVHVHQLSSIFQQEKEPRSILRKPCNGSSEYVITSLGFEPLTFRIDLLDYQALFLYSVYLGQTLGLVRLTTS